MNLQSISQAKSVMIHRKKIILIHKQSKTIIIIIVKILNLNQYFYCIFFWFFIWNHRLKYYKLLVNLIKISTNIIYYNFFGLLIKIRATFVMSKLDQKSFIFILYSLWRLKYENNNSPPLKIYISLSILTDWSIKTLSIG